MLTEMLMLKLTYTLALKCRGIDDESLGYNSKEFELLFEDEVDSENDISVGKYVKYEVGIKVEYSLGKDVDRDVDAEIDI